MANPSLDCNRFCVVIPAHNEAPTIASVVRECKSVCNNVFVIDDGSMDATARIAANNGAFILQLDTHLGLGNALRTGFRHALQHGFAHVVTVDADGVHDPDDINRIVRYHIEEDCDVTLGSRAGNDGTFSSLPNPKAAANRIARLTLNLLFGAAISDWLSGFRVLSRGFLAHDFVSLDYPIAVELVYKAISQKRKIGEVPIRVTYNAEHLYMLTRRELEDFLRFCYRATCHHAFVEALKGVARMEKLRIEIQAERYIAHPITEYQGYIIQQQEFRDEYSDCDAFWIGFDAPP